MGWVAFGDPVSVRFYAGGIERAPKRVECGGGAAAGLEWGSGGE